MLSKPEIASSSLINKLVNILKGLSEASFPSLSIVYIHENF